MEYNIVSSGFETLRGYCHYNNICVCIVNYSMHLEWSKYANMISYCSIIVLSDEDIKITINNHDIKNYTM